MTIKCEFIFNINILKFLIIHVTIDFSGINKIVDS
jgi:hypothetical protein